MNLKTRLKWLIINQRNNIIQILIKAMKTNLNKFKKLMQYNNLLNIGFI